MIIGPVTIQWTKDVKTEQTEAQRLSMVRSRLIVRLRADNAAMRNSLQVMMARALDGKLGCVKDLERVGGLTRVEAPKAGAGVL